MSTIKTNAILDASGGNTTTINGTTPTAYNTMGKNRIINGAMEIDQRNAGASVTIVSNPTYTVDRWRFDISVGSKLSAQQSSVAPVGFSNSMLITSLSAYTPSAGDQFVFNQLIEGFNTSDLNWGTSDAKTVTLSFWVRSSLTGTFGGSIRNNTVNRSYVFSYTINSANTWEQKTITIAGDTTGTWETTNSTGVRLSFSLGSGSSTGNTAGSWYTANYRSVTGETQLVATSGATLYITGVQLEVGSVATEFERRPYGLELSLCQRYYQHSYATGTAVGTATSVGAAHQGGGQNGSTTGYLAGPWILFPVQLRTFPTVTVWDIGGNSGYCHRFTYAVGGANSQPYNIAATSDKSIYGYSSGSTNYAGVAVHWRAEAEL
jgi:hypothetical protein